MKKYVWLAFMILLSTASCLIYVPYDREPSEPGEYYERDYDRELDTSYFYDYLSPYGVWTYHHPHGHVWIPSRMSYRWRPYTYGRWVWTDYGWTWVSYFEWGWIPFHYGRWGWDNDLGWFWVPDTVWGPAWVAWRWSDLYIGWAPLPPDVRFDPRIGIHELPYDFPHNHWVFIHCHYFLNQHIDYHVLPFERNMTIINYTVAKANLYARGSQIVNEGIDIDQLRRVTRQDISKYQLRDAQKPGASRVEAGDVVIYRPSVSKNEAAKPRTVLEKEEARERISRTSIGKPIREEQEEEVKLLEESQEEEVSELKQKVNEEKKLAKNPSEKEEIDKEYEKKVSELKKSHEVEKSSIKQRHKEEEEQAKKKTIKKKENKM